jgi:hypothetical protein
VVEPASLEAEELLVARACRTGNGAQAQSSTDPCATSIAAEQPKRFAGSASPAVRRPLPRAHPSIMTSGDLLPVI